MQVLARLVLVVLVTVGAHVALRVVGLDLGPVLGGAGSAGIAGIALALALRDTAVRTPDGARVLLPDGKVLDALVGLRVRFWHAPPTADHWRVRSAAIVAVTAALERCGLEIPFERTVVDVVRPDGRPIGPAEP